MKISVPAALMVVFVACLPFAFGEEPPPIEPPAIDCYELAPELYWCPEDNVTRYRL